MSLTFFFLPGTLLWERLLAAILVFHQMALLTVANNMLLASEQEAAGSIYLSSEPGR
jgi:hypothetical protein